MIASSPEALHPVTREIIMGGARASAADAFAAFYKLEDLRRVRDHIFRQIDVLLVPTMPTAYTVAQVLADPIGLNSRLGTYTNFVNLLDLAGLALPASMKARWHAVRRHAARAGRAGCAARLARPRVSCGYELPMGATGGRSRRLRRSSPAPQAGEIALAVVGAHLSGMPLNRRTRVIRRAAFSKPRRPRRTTSCLRWTRSRRSPGLLRVAAGQGTAIAVELWALPAEGFGRFVAAIPPPLGIGTLALSDGRGVKGFLVEANATAARAISRSFGGWRALRGADAKLFSSIKLTCAATTCQPSGKRTQVCCCRPTLPGTVSRRNSVEATAWSRP